MLLADQKEPALRPAKRAPLPPLNAVESEVVGFFVQLAQVIGLPRSIGEIYGLLFISAQPLPMDDLTARLKLSKGSASQGLKLLRSAGAVHVEYVPLDRRVHYRAATELRKVITRFLLDRVLPPLDTGGNRLKRLAAMTDDLPAADRANAKKKIALLQSWEKNTRQFVPILVKMLQV